ncbi:MAG: hypothetical protein EU539_05185 [Promethearchaeota archaeon]|nr:MAG: hypothetical protein EU539_05185 [Candidatus Lokiarchaeota archaeon]
MDVMEITSMIVKKFNVNQFELQYSVGVGKLRVCADELIDEMNLTKENELLDSILNVIERIEHDYKDITIQLFSDKYIINQNHVFNACYFTQKAFLNNSNISNRKNIELLLYMAANRQIKIAIDAFGIGIRNLKKGELCYCIISAADNLLTVNEAILRSLKAEEIDFNIGITSKNKIKELSGFFDIADVQINIILKSYGIKKVKNATFEQVSVALNDLLCERMTLLSLEKLKM